MKALRIILLLVVCSLSHIVYGQGRDLTFTIENYIQQGDYINACKAADSAIKISELSNLPRTWYLRGFAYKEYYKKYEIGTHALTTRDIAAQSFLQSIKLDTKAELVGECKKNLETISKLYFSDVKMFMDSFNPQPAIKYYDLFKRTRLAADSSFDFQKNEILFNLTLGTTYMKLAETTDTTLRKEYLAKEREAFLKVLAVDPNNITANYNMALLYYNQAVKIINAMGYDEDIVTLNMIVDNCTGLFKESLPFMEKAYHLNPNRRETLVGLSGIYFSLNEEEKRQYIDLLLEELDRNKK